MLDAIQLVHLRSRRALGAASLVVAIAAVAPASATAAFGTATAFPTSARSTLAVAVGDFNGDGKQDLVAANDGFFTNAGSVSILLGDGAGGFGAATTKATSNSDTQSVAIGDFNGDGKQDLAAANDTSHNVSILLGDGSGGFGVETAFATNGQQPLSVAVGDFNSDGNQDLATANGNGTVSILSGNGAGSFATAASTTSTNSVSAQSVAVGDFNGDGNQDLATADPSSGTGTVSILLGNGAGAFTAGTTPTLTNGPTPTSVVVGDFNGDGNQDLATANHTGSGSVSILLGDGTGAFTAAATPTATNSAQPISVAVGDFNGDGNEDLATANGNGSGGSVSILLGDGSGRFTAATPTAVNSSSPASVAVGDFNGDTNADLVTANDDTAGSVSVLLSTDAVAANLVANGGAEAPGASGTPPLPVGWTRTVGTAFTQIRYGAGSGFLGLFDGPRWRGVNAYFSGGPNTPLSAAAQTVDVSGSAESIDAGRASIGLSGMLGGFSSQDDNVQVTAQYLDAAGGALGTAAAIGPVTAAQRHNITTLLPRSTTAPVPPGTRKIRVTITATRVGGGSYDDGSADNVRLTLAAPGPPAGPAPPPRLALSGLALKPRSFRAARRGASIAKRRPARTGTTITFTLNRAATTTFTVTRKARGVRSGKRCVAPPRKPRRGKKARKCTRTITAGSFKAIGRTGLTTLHFSGRLRGRKLARGGYQLNATAGDSTGRTKPARKAFKIIG